MGFHFVVSIYFRTTILYLTINQQITQHQLFQIPQRYRFSSKSQPRSVNGAAGVVVLDTTKVQIFKQITTECFSQLSYSGCFRYHKGTDFQANHNQTLLGKLFRQLFQIPQRYRFSSKSQLQPKPSSNSNGCFRYHKGTDFQANHNYLCLQFVLA